MADVKPGSTQQKEGSEIEKELSLLANGKRNLLCGEIPQAVNQLQEACRLFAAKYGDLDDKCGEVYLCYGTALLDLSRMESGVLGNALQGMDEKEDSETASSDARVEDPDACTGEEREKLAEDVIDAMLETDEEVKARKEKETPKQNGHAEESSKEEKKETEKEKTGEGKTIEADASKEAKTAETKKEEEGEAMEVTESDKKEGESTAENDKKEDTKTEKDKAEKDDSTEKDKIEDAVAQEKTENDKKEQPKAAETTDNDKKEDSKKDATGKDIKEEPKTNEKTESDKKEEPKTVDTKDAEKDEKKEDTKDQKKGDQTGKEAEKEKTEEKKESMETEEKKGDQTAKEAEKEKTEEKKESMETEEKKGNQAAKDAEKEKTEEKKESMETEEKTGNQAAKEAEKEKTEEKKVSMETEDEKTKKDSDEKTEGEGTEAEGTEAESEDIAEDEGEEEGEEEEDGEEDMEADGAGEGSSTDPEGSKKKEEEDDVSNLQLAWEILELAKVIYSRHETKEMKLKAAEAYLKLGEVGLETEQYEQAIGDLKECLKLQQKHLEPESRLIAETHYQIGLACSFNSQHDDALSEFRLAVKTIETKIAKLKTVIESSEKEGKGKEPASFDDPVVQAQKEVKDLQEILPDILAKIEDTEDEKRNQDKVKELVKENVASDLGTTVFGEASSVTAVKSASDITHLVRKKRKPEDESDQNEEVKKPKTEENGGGDAPTNGVESKAEDTKSTEVEMKSVEEVQKEAPAAEAST